jgi:uroporphyrinogen decarboxylase
MRRFRPDAEGFVRNILRKGTPERVYFIELFHDPEIEEALVRRFDLDEGLDRRDPDYARHRHLAFQRFCGLDYVRVPLLGMDLGLRKHRVRDTAGLGHAGGRAFVDTQQGPLATWQDFEAFPWPDSTCEEADSELQWWQEHLPEDMCLATRSFGHFAEWLTWLMGYEALCYALYDQRDLVEAIADKLLEINRGALERYLAFSRVRIVWASDDMGFRSGTLLSPGDMRTFVLSSHREMARQAHDAGRLYLLHSCGRLTAIMDDLVEDVGIDGKHSFEDTIEDVREVKCTYGQRTALLGGLDMDFLCRATPDRVRERVRDTLDVCLPGGGYCLGTGNSVANYVPLNNYLAMLDEGRTYTG